MTLLPLVVTSTWETRKFSADTTQVLAADSDSCILTPDFCAISTELNRTPWLLRPELRVDFRPPSA